MKLNMRIVKDWLEKRFVLMYKGDMNSSISFDRPLVYHERCRIEQNALYISDGEILSSKLNGTSFVALGKSNLNTNVVEVYDEITLPELFNIVQEIFVFFGNWERSLYSALHDKTSLADLITVSLPVFENAIVIANSEYKILYDSGHDIPTYKGAPTIADTGYLSPEVVNSYKVDSFFNEVRAIPIAS